MPGQDGVDRIFGAGDRFGDRGARNRLLRQVRAREVQRAIRPGADDYLVTAHGEGQLGARLKNVGIGPSPPIIFPGGPERWWGDEALKAETDTPQATLEQRHQAAGDVLALRCRGFFSAGVLFSMASHSPVETAQ